MEKKPLLSICIPTYNRDKFLDEAIESVISQITKDIKDKVELCISDNASTDNTDKVIEKWKLRSPINIIYHKNKDNLGADRNYLKVIEIANGEYCWFLGSDDRIENDGLKYVLTMIENYMDIDIFILYRRGYNFTFSNPIKLNFDPLSSLNENKIFDPVLELGNYAYMIGYISVLCFRRNLWKKIENCEEFIGSAYVHVCKILSMIKSGAKVMFLKRPVVGWRSENDSFLQANYYKRLKLDIEGYSSIASFVFGKNSNEFKSLINNIISTLFNPFRISATVARINFKERIKLLYLMFKYGYYKSFKFYYFTFPFFFVPKHLHFLLRKIKRKLKGEPN